MSEGRRDDSTFDVGSPSGRHIHDGFRCPAHAGACDCPDLEGWTCNPYRVAGHCPDDLMLMPGDAPCSPG